jgi:ABC-type sugar transport system substrate-binding protein
MSMFARTTFATALVAAGLGFAALPASASAQSAGQGCVSPPGMNYQICNGQRVPKPGNRVATANGGWREESKQGNCIVVREKTATGEFKESRRCD